MSVRSIASFASSLARSCCWRPFLAPAVFAPLGAWRYAVIAAGAVLLGTAVFRFCPAYMLLGIRTCPRNKA